MKRAKFSLNAFILIVILFSALLFFVVLTLSNLADRSAINEYYPIGDTDLGVRYSNRLENGIYQGPENAGTLLVSGDFGHDWGAALADETLYINEYRASSLGLTFCDVSVFDLTDLTKRVLMQNAVLRGENASGDLVCIDNYLLPSNYPKDNPLCKLYLLAYPKEKALPEVVVLDPASGEELARIPDPDIENGFEGKYLESTTEELN